MGAVLTKWNEPKWVPIQYIPWNMHIVLLCLVWLWLYHHFIVFMWYMYPYTAGLFRWHDDFIGWKYFPCYWSFVRGISRSPVNSPYKGQWRGALVFSLICAWINDWVNNREAGDLRCHRAHYDVNVMWSNRMIALLVLRHRWIPLASGL